MVVKYVTTRILVINPGSTSTKIAVYDDKTVVFNSTIRHNHTDLEKYEELDDQYEMRRDLILENLKAQNIDTSTINVIVSRGGLLPPIEAGAYEINEDMVYQLRYHPQNIHASNLGPRIAFHLAKDWNIKSYIYDAITVDELIPIARVTGLKEMQRKGMGHALNMRATAIKYAERTERPYESLNVIVAHLGGGITLSLQSNGRMIDMIADDDGPFSPERAGCLPVYQVIEMMEKEHLTEKQFFKILHDNGGLKSLLGTKDVLEVEKMIQDGDENAKLIYQAMALNIAKSIAKLSAVVSGNIDAILLTGGIARSEMLTGWIKEYISFIAPVEVFPGEFEMDALAFGALRVMNGEENAKTFKKVESLTFV